MAGSLRCQVLRRRVMFNNQPRLMITLFIFLSGQIVQNASAQESLCIPSGYTVGFFNGVFNTSHEAQKSANALTAVIPKKINNENISVELFYNTSGAVSGGSATRWQDLAEVFSQRSQELGAALANQWEFYWSSIGANSGFWDILSAAMSGFPELFAKWRTDIKGKMIAAITGVFSNPPTAADYARHQQRIITLLNEKQKLLFVAHSQGNLFANTAFNFARGITSTDSVKVVHVAPASVDLKGEYTLADIDLIIEALRDIAPGNTPSWNIRLPFDLAQDPSGHTFLGTYLDNTRASYAQITSQSVAALNSLATPTTHGNQGFFTVTLTWDGSGDVDLHVFEPRGTHVYYGKMTGKAGFLDTDNVVSTGPEHYYASCSATQLETGVYKIAINNFARASGRLASIQIASALNGVIYTSPNSVSVGPELGISGNSSPIPVIDVLVSKDPTNGKYIVTTQ